jgi:hypothetical protein
VHYKGYLIQTLETSPSGWRAIVRRLDGQKIKILTPRKEVESIETGGMESFSVEGAEAVAKETIDDGGMQ